MNHADPKYHESGPISLTEWRQICHEAEGQLINREARRIQGRLAEVRRQLETGGARVATRTEHLLEYAAATQGRVDRAANVLRGVKVIGLDSSNGRRYPIETLRAALPMYENAKVNINHRDGGGPRDYQDRIGTLKNVRAEADGLRADLHFNPSHPQAAQLLWDAENNPGNLGLSHSVDGETRYEDGRTVVSKINKVHSVDLVADPATTGGLWESTRTGPRGGLLSRAY
jgi:hypothetical protein